MENSAYKWSNYTSAIECDNDGTLLYNSFMGAISHLPLLKFQAIENKLKQGVITLDESDEVLSSLCKGGFLVPCRIENEYEAVSKILDMERKSVFNAILLANENCNFRCTYCYESYERNRMEKGVISGLKTFINNKTKEHNRISTVWFGGEPLLSKDVIYELSDSFLNSCEKNDASYVSSMTTNGYLLTEDTIDKLLYYKVKHLQITLDGPSRIHDANRKLVNGKGTYNKILDNLITLKNKNDDFSCRIRINYNATSLPLIEDWIKKEIAPLFANDARFALRFHAIGKWGGPNDEKLDTYGCTAASYDKTSKMFEKFYHFGSTEKIIKEFLSPHGNVCYASKENSIVIGADGQAYKCTVAFNDKRNQIGNLDKDGKLTIDYKLWDLWTNPANYDSDKCVSCSMYPSCGSRKCPLAAMNSGILPCPMSKSMDERFIRLIYNKSQEVVYASENL